MPSGGARNGFLRRQPNRGGRIKHEAALHLAVAVFGRLPTGKNAAFATKYDPKKHYEGIYAACYDSISSGDAMHRGGSIFQNTREPVAFHWQGKIFLPSNGLGQRTERP